MHLPPGGPIDPAWAILFGGLRCATLTSDDGVPLPGMVVSLEDIETMANTFDDLLVKYGKRKAPLWTPN